MSLHKTHLIIKLNLKRLVYTIGSCIFAAGYCCGQEQSGSESPPEQITDAYERANDAIG